MTRYQVGTSVSKLTKFQIQALRDAYGWSLRDLITILVNNQFERAQVNGHNMPDVSEIRDEMDGELLAELGES